MEVARKGEVHVWLHSHYLCLGMCMHCLIAMTDTDLTATLSKRSSEGCFKIENKETWDAEIIAPPQVMSQWRWWPLRNSNETGN